MPIIDRREIEFDAKAIMSAIALSANAAQGFGLLGIPPIDVRFRPRDGRIDIIYGTSQAPRAISIAAEPLGALLVSYCIRARIPMPKQSNKGIRIEARSAILAFRTDFVEMALTLSAEATTGSQGSVTAWTWVDPAVGLA